MMMMTMMMMMMILNVQSISEHAVFIENTTLWAMMDNCLVS